MPMDIRQQSNQIPNRMGIPSRKRGTERIEHHISSNIIIQETCGDPKRDQPLTLKSYNQIQETCGNPKRDQPLTLKIIKQLSP